MSELKSVVVENMTCLYETSPWLILGKNYKTYSTLSEIKQNDW